MNNVYEKQARLLLRVLSLVDFGHPKDNELPFFALKGGTALNFFRWNLPRLSVDIDLAYCPVTDRQIAFDDIKQGLASLVGKISKAIPEAGISITAPPHSVPKVLVSHDNTTIKVEPNGVIRGTVYETEYLNLQPAVEEHFEMAVSARCLSKPDLYGGKICAALDRQHPRDLFDGGQILREGGITDKIRTAFLVYLISHNRPMAEVLKPGLQDLEESYAKEFEGMTNAVTSIDRLEEIRTELFQEVGSCLRDKDKEFLMSIKKGTPNWSLLNISHASELPAIKWKLHNIDKLMRDKDKHLESLKKLENCLADC